MANRPELKKAPAGRTGGTAGRRHRLRGRGRVQVYTGNGKGKTTAALGLALRAAGRGMRTYVGQFMKGQPYGELEAPRLLGGLVTIEQFGRRGFVHAGKTPRPRDVALARRALAACRKAILSGDYDIVVLDEVNVAVAFSLVRERDVLRLIASRPPRVEIVLTGRYAPASFIEKADLVTEMSEVKHYYRAGVGARDGIER